MEGKPPSPAGALKDRQTAPPGQSHPTPSLGILRPGRRSRGKHLNAHETQRKGFLRRHHFSFCPELASPELLLGHPRFSPAKPVGSRRPSPQQGAGPGAGRVSSGARGPQPAGRRGEVGLGCPHFSLTLTPGLQRGPERSPQRHRRGSGGPACSLIKPLQEATGIAARFQRE